MTNKLFCFFILFCIKTGSAQVADSSKKANNKLRLSVALGAQVVLMDTTDFMFGTNLVINSLWHRILLSLNLHLAASNHSLGERDFIVENIRHLSLMPGYRIYENGSSAFQAQAGISYGYLWYRGEEHKSSGWFSTSKTYYDREKIYFIGFPFKLSYLWYPHKIGWEIYGFANLHTHYETALGLNIHFGK